MRNLVKIVLLIMLTAGLSSCEKIKSIFDVEFDTTFSGDLDIDIQETPLKSTNNYKFLSTTTVDPLDYDDIEEYIDNIKDFKVNDVVATVTWVSSEKVWFKSGTAFSVYNSTDSIAWELDSDWTVVEGAEISMGDIGGVYKKVADILDTKGKFMMGAKGVSSETGVSITIKLAIGTEVTANPL